VFSHAVQSNNKSTRVQDHMNKTKWNEDAVYTGPLCLWLYHASYSQAVDAVSGELWLVDIIPVNFIIYDLYHLYEYSICTVCKGKCYPAR
jgi:hypothetical protein